MSENLCEALKDVLKSVESLRHPDTGCPWDIQQTQESLIPYVVEEAYEVSEAILEKDQKKICDELGDYLFQVLIQCQIAQEKGDFNLQDVLQNLNAKLIRRHPHVFSGERVSGLEEVQRRWDEIKRLEKGSTQSQLDQDLFKKSKSVTPMKAAQVIGKATHQVAFDWTHWTGVLSKTQEEWEELRVELEKPEVDLEAVEHELGDVFFSLVQLGRHLNLDSELALHKTNTRFKKRFQSMVELSGMPLSEFSTLAQEQKEAWYQKAKQLHLK